MSRLASLKAAATLADLAKLLEFTASGLSYVVFKQPDAAKYKTFEIPKRTGGTRKIQAPLGALKLVQQRLSVLLQDCLDEIISIKKRKDRIAHGFKRKRSIITNAREHRNRRYVFNIDLEDFFPSINFGRVRGYFIKDNSFGLNQEVATAIARIACHDNFLPQGSPCSPVISNLIAHVLDMHLVSARFRSRVHLFTLRGRSFIFHEQDSFPEGNCTDIGLRSTSLAAWWRVTEAHKALWFPHQCCQDKHAVPNVTPRSDWLDCKPENQRTPRICAQRAGDGAYTS